MRTLKLSSVISIFMVFVLLAAGGASSARAQDSQPQGITGGGGPGLMFPAFTYQGQLKNNSSPVNGTCDFRFSLGDQSSGGNQIGTYEYESAVPVTNGLFTVILNANGEFNPGSNSAFQGDLRYLLVEVRCPAGSGSYVALSPRQLITAVPYALTLVPGSGGSRVNGAAYQLLKVTNSTTGTGIPASVTGETTASTDGVGVYGSNTVSTAGAKGIGVWGRTYSPSGFGVLAEGYTGAVGLKAIGYSGGAGLAAYGSGVDQNHPAIYAENTNTKNDTTPAGIAIYGLNHGADAAIVGQNTGSGDIYRGINPANTNVVFRVTNTGHVISAAASVTGGSDLAEQFAVSGAAPEPGTLMVLDAANPGQLVPSTAAYDTKVAGVVSGAGGLQPGFTLAEQDGAPIAISGRVYVKAEAISGPIHVGDLLTSSDMPGYAMAATDHTRALGAVIGKAMSNLDSGTGLVLVLVNLQ